MHPTNRMKATSRNVAGYVKAVLALKKIEKRRAERYDRYVRPLDRKRDALIADVALRARALNGGQTAQALSSVTYRGRSSPDTWLSR